MVEQTLHALTEFLGAVSSTPAFYVVVIAVIVAMAVPLILAWLLVRALREATILQRDMIEASQVVDKAQQESLNTALGLVGQNAHNTELLRQQVSKEHDHTRDDQQTATNVALKQIERLCATITATRDALEKSIESVIDHVTTQAALTFEEVQATRADVAQVSAAVEVGRQGIDDISTVMGNVKIAVDTLTGAVETLSKRAVTQEFAETLAAEVRGLGALIQVLDQRLVDYQESKPPPVEAADATKEASLVYGPVPDTAR